MKLFLSIIIPSFNEKTNFKKGVLKKVVDYLKSFSYKRERKPGFFWDILYRVRRLYSDI